MTSAGASNRCRNELGRCRCRSRSWSTGDLIEERCITGVVYQSRLQALLLAPTHLVLPFLVATIVLDCLARVVSVQLARIANVVLGMATHVTLRFAVPIAVPTVRID